MKKVIFSLAALLLVCALAFSQKTNTEVYNTILRSKDINLQRAGVINPNLIFPGQMLTFLFTDGKEEQFVVEKGDNQWVIVRDKLAKLEAIHGPVINYPFHETGTTVDLVQPEKNKFPWLLTIILVFVLYSLFFFYTLWKNKQRDADPVTAGPAQVEGGVTDAKAYARMEELAAQRFPGATLVIKNIRRGLLSGPADIYYAGSTKPKQIKLKNVHTFAGEILVNGHIQTIYYLQPCGNDAREGNFISGKNLTFVPDVIVNEDGSTAVIPFLTPTTAPVAPVVKTDTVVETPTTEPTTPVVVAPQGSEFFQNTTNALAIVGKFLETNESRHKVTLKVTKDSVEAVIENNNRGDQPKAQKNANEKE